MFKRSIYFLVIIAFSCNVFTACKGKKSGSSKVYKDQVVIHELSDPKGLNAVVTSDAVARDHVIPNIFQSLLGYNHETMEKLPILAKARPTITTNGDLIEMTYELRPEAVWDNGTPVTAEDVIFTYKAIFCPKVNSDNLKPSIDFVQDIKTDPSNNRKFTFICKKNIGIEDATGWDIKIIPEYTFDAKKTLRKFSLADFIKATSTVQNDKDIQVFAEFFNSEDAARKVELCQGSGAYKYVSWETGQRMILEKKQNWWGDKLAKENEFFEAYPKKLIFETINDYTTALTALVDEKIDFIYVTPVKDYVELSNSDKFKQNYEKSEPQMLSYQAIGINVKDKILKDVKIRQALCHLTNVDQIIDKVLYGKGVRLVGTVLPSKKEAYNNDIKPYDFDLNKAKTILAEAGWVDSDGDGILDKIIEGQKTKLEISYSYNSGNPIRETVGLLLQQTLKQAGISLQIKALDWALYLDELKKHNCQMYYQAWVKAPGPDDEKQIFHSTSANGGSNYMNFGDAKSDELIEKIRTEMDETKRNILYKEWQQLTHEQVPYIFLYVQNFRNCIHKRFENTHVGPVYPGVWFASFKVKDGYKVEASK